MAGLLILCSRSAVQPPRATVQPFSRQRQPFNRSAAKGSRSAVQLPKRAVQPLSRSITTETKLALAALAVRWPSKFAGVNSDAQCCSTCRIKVAGLSGFRYSQQGSEKPNYSAIAPNVDSFGGRNCWKSRHCHDVPAYGNHKSCTICYPHFFNFHLVA